MTTANNNSWMTLRGVDFSAATDVNIPCGDATSMAAVTPAWKQGLWTNQCATNFKNCGVTLSASEKLVHNPTIVEISPTYTWVTDPTNPFEARSFQFGVGSLSEEPIITPYLDGLLGECFVSVVKPVSTLSAINRYVGILGKPQIPTTATLNNQATAVLGYSFEVTIEIWPANAPAQLVGLADDSQSDTIESVSSFSLVCRISDNLTNSSVFSKTISVIHPTVVQLGIDDGTVT